MNILQIVVGYFGSKLYKNLFSKNKDNNIDDFIIVPTSNTEESSEEANVKVLPCFNQLDRIIYYSKQRKMYNAIRNNCNIDDFDIIHAHTLFSSGYVAQKIHEEYSIPYIVAVRNTDVNVFFKKMIHLRKLGIEIMRNAKYIVFLSPAYKEDVINSYVPKQYKSEIRDKSLVIPNGIDDYFLLNKNIVKSINKNSIKLIYIGEINDNKNVMTSINVVKLLNEKGIKAKLTVVGEITDKKYKKILMKEKNVSYFEKCNKQEVLKHLRNNDIFIMPSYNETFGLVYAEALSQGLPIIYTKNQGFDKQFPEGHVGYSVSPNNVAEITGKIEKIIDNYSDISKRCLEGANKFDWMNISKKYKSVYEHILVDNTKKFNKLEIIDKQ